jgi:hypothetical protein
VTYGPDTYMLLYNLHSSSRTLPLRSLMIRFVSFHILSMPAQSRIPKVNLNFTITLSKVTSP